MLKSFCPIELGAYGYFRCDVTDQRHHRQVDTHPLALETVPQIFRHCIDFRSDVYRHEKEAQQQENPAGMPLVCHYPDSARCAATSQTNEVFRAHVTCIKTTTDL